MSTIKWKIKKNTTLSKQFQSIIKQIVKRGNIDTSIHLPCEYMTAQIPGSINALQ